MNPRAAIRRVVPYPVRMEFARLRRLPRWLVEARTMARRPPEPLEAGGFAWVLASHRSPLDRVPGALAPALQRGKETNVRLAASRLDGVVVEPNQVFSYHHVVGRTTRRRGFGDGLELRDGRPAAGVGGGLCQVSNSLYWVALQAGMRIVERHRHGLDLFPDHARTVPFGCGATVVYNYADLRFENPFDQPVVIGTGVVDGSFSCELRTRRDPGVRVEVNQVDHRFLRDGDGWVRENRIRRRIRSADGSLLVDEEVAHNRGHVQYEPTVEQLRCGGEERRTSEPR